MKRRLKSLSRLVEVQSQLHRAAEARLALLRRDEAAIERELHELIAALNGDDALRGLFFDAAIRRMKSLADKGDAMRRAVLAQEREVLRHGGRLKQAERLFKTAEGAAKREAEKDVLADIVDDLVGRGASLP